MLLTPHLLAGLLVGNITNNPFLAGVGGLGSYFLLEMIPHWDPENRSRKIVVAARALDLIFSVVLVLGAIYVLSQPQRRIFIDITSPLIISNVVINKVHVLGFAMAGITYMFFSLINFLYIKTGKFSAFVKFKKLITYTDRSVWGVLVQVAICILSVVIVLHLLPFSSFDRIQKSIL